MQNSYRVALQLQSDSGESVFALVLDDDVPEARVIAGDFIFFDRNIKPQPGDICIDPLDDRLFLLQVNSMTFD